jgi:hypothetical protein
MSEYRKYQALAVDDCTAETHTDGHNARPEKG